MSNPFVAEIRIFAFNFAPKGWAFCDGQLLPISQNTALFSLLGTFYGGNGSSNFNLPNLQGSVAMHTDQFLGPDQNPIGTTAGETTVTLLTSEMPAHSHSVQADVNHRNALSPTPANAVPANPAPLTIYSQTLTQSVNMNAAMVGVAGSSNPHNNMMPSLTLNYCIALQGVYPPRT
jgi:microcystin-dependent protein